MVVRKRRGNGAYDWIDNRYGILPDSIWRDLTGRIVMRLSHEERKRV